MTAEELQALRGRLSNRLNDVLCEMKPDHDDSVVGFNEAWDVVRKFFDDEAQRLAGEIDVSTVGEVEKTSLQEGDLDGAIR